MPKTVLLDGNNIMMRSLHTDGTLIIDPNDKNNIIDYDWNNFKFSIFKSIYYSIIQARGASECVFAIDGSRDDTWRKKYWVKYKSNRDKLKDSNNIKWDLVFENYLSFLDEIKSSFPVRVIRHKFSEGDDVIGTIVLNTPQEHYIVSVDKDFQQLYEKGRVTIYSPLKQSTIEHPNPEFFIIEQCLIGQAKDNIFNIKTPLDYPDDKRKPGFGEKALEKVMIHGWKEWLKENKLEERFEFNRNLIDFRRIPKVVQKGIMELYKVKNYPEPSRMYEFMKKYGWNSFLDEWTKVEYTFMELY